jgi:hypothetical protein
VISAGSEPPDFVLRGTSARLIRFCFTNSRECGHSVISPRGIFPVSLTGRPGDFRSSVSVDNTESKDLRVFCSGLVPFLLLFWEMEAG